MKNIKVLGTDCANCRNTVQMVEAVARERGIDIVLEKVEDMQAGLDLLAFTALYRPTRFDTSLAVHWHPANGGVPWSWCDRPPKLPDHTRAG